MKKDLLIWVVLAVACAVVLTGCVMTWNDDGFSIETDSEVAGEVAGDYLSRDK